jgi:hypothetical protein
MSSNADHELRFDAGGRLLNPDAERQLADAVRGGRTDLFVMAHGWNNTPEVARRLWSRFFAQVAPALSAEAAGRTATVGVLWPSMRWADEPFPGDSTGGAAAVGGPVEPGVPAVATATDPVEQLRPQFPGADQQQALDRVQQLLASQPQDPSALKEFQEQLAVLAAVAGQELDPEDRTDEPLLHDDPERLFTAFADLSPGAEDGGGAAGLGDGWKRIWRGAREALRATTYYEMKNRAGVIGQHGLGPLIARLPAGVKVHLIGHSFGGRLVSFALAGLPPTAVGPASPVGSLVLVQAAFSHYSFAPKSPFRQQAAVLAGMEKRVSGPVVVTHSRRDLALADLYPKASIIRGQDSSGLQDLLTRWGALGYDGVQQVEARSAAVREVGFSYPFAPSGFFNLDCNELIRNGPWPVGGHSDIVHRELGWVVSAAAGTAT